MPSPSQPTAPLTDAELTRCRDAVGGALLGPGPIILAYSTSIPEEWLLGASAALHGAPLVLAGLGRRGWPWWSGGGGKLTGVARALQVINAIAPDAPVVFADGGDTIISNRWTRADALSLLGTGAKDVLIGGECNSWPLCYNASYLRVPAYRDCVASGSPTCYANSGMYLGRPAQLMRFVQRLRDIMTRLDQRGYRGKLEAEKGNDQSAVHHAYLESRGVTPWEEQAGLTSSATTIAAGGSSRWRMAVDGESAFFLSLYICGGRRYSMRGRGPHEYCSEAAFDAMPRLSPGGNGTRLAYATASPAPPRQPFLLHANGKHYRLHERPLRPLLRRLRDMTTGVTAKAASHKVVLVDAVAIGETCGVAGLDRVLRGAKDRTIAAPLAPS